MKIGIKIIKFKDGTWGAKKRGLFGWKYLNDIYDGFYCSHYSWCYFVPDSVNDKFKTKRECVKTLSDYYHGERKLQEVLV
jgi:hypothetical protein